MKNPNESACRGGASLSEEPCSVRNLGSRPRYERTLQYWLPVYQSSKLKHKPVKVLYNGLPVVLFRSGSSVAALVDRCPHRGAPLSQGSVKDGCVTCPYHGWSFQADGQCRKIPGRETAPNRGQSAQSVAVQESHGFIWLGPEGALLPYISPYLSDPGYHRFSWSIQLEGDMLDIIENFLDATHTHHVHSGLIRSDGPRTKVRVDVVRENDQCSATYHGEQHSSGLIAKLFEGTRTTSSGRFALPATAEIEYRSATRVEFAMTAYLAPAQADRFSIQVTIATPRGLIPAALKQLVLTPFLKLALRQDRQILEIQRANLRNFPDHRHTSTELDVLRPHILHLVNHGPSSDRVERTVKMSI